MSSTTATKTKKKNELMPFEEASFIKILSNDGMEFIVDQRCLESSKKLNDVISKSEVTDEELKIPVVEIDGDAEVTEKLIDYFYYKTRWDKNPDERPKFEIDPTIALNLMVCAYKYDA